MLSGISNSIDIMPISQTAYPPKRRSNPNLMFGKGEECVRATHFNISPRTAMPTVQIQKSQSSKPQTGLAVAAAKTLRRFGCLCSEALNAKTRVPEPKAPKPHLNVEYRKYCPWAHPVASTRPTNDRSLWSSKCGFLGEASLQRRETGGRKCSRRERPRT